MHVIPALRRLRQEDHELESTLGYIVSPRRCCYIIRPCLKKEGKKGKEGRKRENERKKKKREISVGGKLILSPKKLSWRKKNGR
jgi:hypothetical protein